MAAAHSCICIFMGSELGHWQDFLFWQKLSGHIRFAGLSAKEINKKITVGASVKGNKTLMWMGRFFLIKGPIPFKIHLTRAL